MANEDVTVQAEAVAPAAPGWTPEQAPLGPTKPKNNVYTFLMIVAAIFICVSIYLVAYELNKFYGVTFAGIVSPPSATATK
ncbi:MAG: hypothetical protein WC980_01405 [Candidatus Brocadiia bacterium]